MKYSAKLPTPVAMAEWLVDASDDWIPSYGTFSGTPRIETWNYLLAEQDYLCAYCGRELNAGRTDSHIDHFWPQAHFKNMDLEYSNFFASCGPPGLPRAQRVMPRTRGDTKGNWFDEEHHLLPSDPQCEAHFQYGQTGEIRAFDEEDVAAVNMIRVLNLNERSLTLERRAIIKALEEAIAQNELAIADVEAEIERFRTPEDGRRRNFSQVAVRYLEVEFL